MKISRIEFENFRNFKEYGCIDFPTDGSVAVIYGTNGVGKTTLHQLFQWIFYGEVHFNKTAGTEMYNRSFEQAASYHQDFSVWGAIDFEHPNEQGVIESYSLRRSWLYRKEQYESKIVDRKCRLLKKIGDNWKTISDDPTNNIEQILPSGLSQYFFFDGESMIADLNQKGRESAKALRKALYSIFDLDIYENAIKHIGAQTSGVSTVLGKLYYSRAEASSDMDVIKARGDYRQAQTKVENFEKEISDCKVAIDRRRKAVQEISEKIGGNPSQKELEKRRARANDNIKTLNDAILREMKNFGKTVMDNYPYLLISRIVEEAQLRIGLKVEDEKLLPGLRKELVLTLLNEDTCLCGNTIGPKERAALEELKKMFPPLSYKYIYDQFKNAAVRWSATYDEDRLIKHLEVIFKYRDQIEKLRTEIHDIDEEQKQGMNVDELIDNRAKIEEQLDAWNDKLKEANQGLGLWKKVQKQRKDKLDKLLEANNTNRRINTEISIMEEVKHHFENKLSVSAKEYSERLEKIIQTLIDKMFTGTRKVGMTSAFEFSVKDSHGNQAKSEGQFAVVSFAYIGGIFKLLQEITGLKEKEFPLVLDGPFSKLDALHRQKVIDVIPNCVPQIILFSKDDINSCFKGQGIKHVWTIYSNDERNISYVKKGYDPEVFEVNGNNN